jgi:hypothetical protein
MKANPTKTGLTLGALICVWHILWSLLVLFGWAQPILTFVFWAHMIQPIYVVQGFNPAAAGTLIAITFVSGFFFGWVGALIWNGLQRRPAPERS